MVNPQKTPQPMVFCEYLWVNFWSRYNRTLLTLKGNLNSTETTTKHNYDDIKWTKNPCHWSFTKRIHCSPMNSPHKGQCRRVWCFLSTTPEQTVEQRLEKLVLWDAIALIWRHSNDRAGAMHNPLGSIPWLLIQLDNVLVSWLMSQYFTTPCTKYHRGTPKTSNQTSTNINHQMSFIWRRTVYAV